jgi:hypothetical protein
MSIPVSEIQWLQIANAAEALSPPDREPFVARIARELEGKPIGEGTVARAVATSFKVFFIPPDIPRLRVPLALQFCCWPVSPCRRSRRKITHRGRSH